MGSTLREANGGRQRGLQPARWSPRRDPGGSPRLISKAPPNAFQRARHRRSIARRVVCVLALSFVLVLLLLGVLPYGASPSEQRYLQPILPVEAGTLPSLPDPPDPLDSPDPPPLDMGQVWAAAITKDPWPDLATGGRTGTSGGKVALTFDDGPEPRTTLLILDTLRKYDLKATFFVLGSQVEENPGLLRRIVEEGHTLGNHTYNHANMSGLSAKQMRNELRSTQRAVDDALGYHYPMMLMRPPYGDPYLEGSGTLPVFRRIVREQGLLPVMWTVDSNDYLLGSHSKGVVRSVMQANKSGQQRKGDEVLLLHDNQRQTAEALPGIIDYYERSGRQFAGVDELLADKYVDP